MFKNLKQNGIFEVFLLASCLGPSFLFSKIAVPHINPFSLVMLRVSIAGLILLIILKLREIRIPKDLVFWKNCFVLGFFLNGLPFITFSFGLQYLPSSLSALINGLVPVITVFLANAFLEDEPLNINRIFGVLLGLTGFLVLFLPTLSDLSLNGDMLGIILCLVGSICYAIGAVYARRTQKNAPPLVGPTLQLLSSLIYLVPLSIIFGSLEKLPEAPPLAWLGVIGTSIFGTLLSFILYHRIVSKHGATTVSMATYLLPVFASIYGVIFLGEIINLNFIIAALFILSGVAVVNGMVSFNFLIKKPASEI